MISKYIRYALLVIIITIPVYGEKLDQNYLNISNSIELAQNSDANNDTSLYNPNAASLKTQERESPLRRFEISFFISAPFVFLITFAGLHTYGAIRKKDTNVSVWKEYKPALLIGTFGISTAIAAHEAWITMGSNTENEEQTVNERALYLYANKRF